MVAVAVDGGYSLQWCWSSYYVDDDYVDDGDYYGDCDGDNNYSGGIYIMVMLTITLWWYGNGSMVSEW